MDIYILQLYISTMSNILSDRGLSLQEEINHVIEHNLAPPERSFYIFCDASKKHSSVGVGWVITNNCFNILCYGTQSVVESGYNTTDIEAFAVESAYLQIEQMNWDTDYLIYTDNNAVVSYLKNRECQEDLPQIKYLQSKIAVEDVEWVNRHYNRAADALAESAREAATHTRTN